MRKKTLVALLSAIMAMCLAIVAFAACGGGNPTVTISQTSASIIVGETVELTATASDESKIEWSSSDATVASVSKGGVVTGRRGGTATITAKAGEATATCEVTVSKIDVTISQTTASIERGQTLTLTATAADNGAITWISSDESVATVANGVVTAIKEGTATITAKRGAAGSASCEVTVVWDSKPADYYEILEGAEMDTAQNLNKFVYWSDKSSYGGSEVTVSQAEYANGVASFSYANATAHSYSFQVFYKNQSNVVGKNYKVELVINSSVAGDITVCGTVVSLAVGENKVEAYYTEREFDYTGAQPAASLTIQMGVESPFSTVVDNTFTISDLKFSEYSPEKLTAPSAVSISAEKVVTITDTTNGKAQTFNLLFYLGGVLKYQVPVENGDAIDTSTMESGVYDIKVVAVGSGKYTSSDESEVLTTYSVSNGSIQYDLENRVEDTLSGKWYYWSEYNAMQNANYNDGVITFSISDAGGNWYSNQIFYKDSALNQGAAYAISLTINVTAACKITINGTAIDLVEGDNNVTVNANQGANSSFSMQLGTIDGGANGVANTYILNNVQFTVGGTTPTPDPEPEVPSDDIVYGEAVNVAISEVINGGEDDAAANAGKLLEWHDQNWCGSTVTLTSSFADGAATLEWTSTGFCWYGVQLFYKDTTHVTGGRYKLTLKINSSVAGDITVNGKVVSLVAGDNDIEVEFVENVKSTISIQMGVESANTMISAATMVISDIAIAAEETQAASSVFDAAGVYGNDSAWDSLV